MIISTQHSVTHEGKTATRCSTSSKTRRLHLEFDPAAQLCVIVHSSAGRRCAQRSTKLKARLHLELETADERFAVLHEQRLLLRAAQRGDVRQRLRAARAPRHVVQADVDDLSVAARHLGHAQRLLVVAPCGHGDALRLNRHCAPVQHSVACNGSAAQGLAISAACQSNALRRRTVHAAFCGTRTRQIAQHARGRTIEAAVDRFRDVVLVDATRLIDARVQEALQALAVAQLHANVSQCHTRQKPAGQYAADPRHARQQRHCGSRVHWKQKRLGGAPARRG